MTLGSGEGLQHRRVSPCCADEARRFLGTTNDCEAAIRKAVGIIELADHRASAADGPVGHVRDELSDKEWRDLYRTLNDALKVKAQP